MRIIINDKKDLLNEDNFGIIPATIREHMSAKLELEKSNTKPDRLTINVEYDEKLEGIITMTNEMPKVYNGLVCTFKDANVDANQ